jgi:hypothetical protein
MMVKLSNAGYAGCFIQTLEDFMIHVRNYIEKGIAPDLQLIKPMNAAQALKYSSRNLQQKMRENKAACELFKL